MKLGIIVGELFDVFGKEIFYLFVFIVYLEGYYLDWFYKYSVYKF